MAAACRLLSDASCNGAVKASARSSAPFEAALLESKEELKALPPGFGLTGILQKKDG